MTKTTFSEREAIARIVDHEGYWERLDGLNHAIRSGLANDEQHMELCHTRDEEAAATKDSLEKADEILAIIARRAPAPPAASPVTIEEEKARVMRAIDAGDATAVCFYDSHTREGRFASLIEAVRNLGRERYWRRWKAKAAEAFATSPVTGALDLEKELLLHKSMIAISAKRLAEGYKGRVVAEALEAFLDESAARIAAQKAEG